MGSEIIDGSKYQALVKSIGELIEVSRRSVVSQINSIMTETYWHIGEYIVNFEQDGKQYAEYGKKVMDKLARDLTLQYGRGFSRSNVYSFRQFYLAYPKIQTLSGHLSWSHYIELLKCNDAMERGFYEKQCRIENWSVPIR